MKARLRRLLESYIASTRPHAGRGILCRLAWHLGSRELIVNLPAGIKLSAGLGDPRETVCVDNFEAHGELEVFLSFLEPGMTVLDVGANIGLYTLHAAKAVGAGGRVYSFEPVPQIAQRLRANLRLNNVSNVSVAEMAVSDADAFADFFYGKSGLLGSLFPLHGRTAGGTVRVATTRLDSFAHEHGIAAIDAAKIDVEGGEMHVLRGMGRLLDGELQPILFVEIGARTLSAAGQSPDATVTMLLNRGYQGFVIREGHLHRVASAVSPTYPREGHANYIFLPPRRHRG